MSKLRWAMALVLSAGLVELVFGVSSASAVSAPGARVCKKVPATQKGLWNTNNCEGTNVANGEYAWSWADNGGEATIYCVLGGERWADSLCEVTGAGPFKEVLTNEAFPDILGLILLSTSIGHAATIATEVRCADGDFVGLPVTATLLIDIVTTFLGCKVLKPANCEVSNLKGIAGTLKTEPETAKLESLTLTNFVPQVSGPFIETEFKGSSCSLKEKSFPTKGSQICEGASPGPAAIEGLMNCKKTGSSLTLGTESLTFEALLHGHLRGSPYWQIR